MPKGKTDKEKFVEKHIDTKEVYIGKILRYQIDDVLLPNGQKTVRDVVKHPGAVAIVAIDDNGDFVFIRQYRYAIDKIIYEIPAGKLNAGEQPLRCAKRELKEETGFTAKKWEKLGSIFTLPGFCDETIHIFKATGLKKGRTNFDEDEVIETVFLSKEKVLEMIKKGRINDGKTLAGIFLQEMNDDISG